MFKRSLLFILFIFPFFGYAQNLQSGFPVFEEYLRRESISDTSIIHSFLVKPLDLGGLGFRVKYFEEPYSLSRPNFESIAIKPLPVIWTTQFNSKRPYGWGDYGMRKNVGFQTYFSSGVYANWGILHLQIQPEFILSQNRPFQGYSSEFSDLTNRIRYVIWNRADDPERFGTSPYSRVWWGQSKFSLKYQFLEIGVSTQNIYWGPGQFNSLLFNHNAEGIPHITFNTTKPAKTFLGNFEWQIVSGKITASNQPPSQVESLNEKYFIPYPDDWKYLNAITLSYNPKWVPGLFIGFARTFQVFNEKRGDSFGDLFPIFEAFQKEKFFENGNTVEFDGNGRDQQAEVFARYVFPKSKFEFYFEYARKDHAFNWRDFILNPDHARAFLLGFGKIVDVNFFGFSKFQIRSEITHLQQSVNRLTRYDSKSRIVGGNEGFGTHSQARGFSNFGQPMGGTAIGTGSNVQILETSLINNFDRVGLRFERLANHQDFYFGAFEGTERKPWIDYSIGLLFDKNIDNLLLSSKLQVIHARNYQWQLDPASTPDFPKGKNLISMMAQVSLIYFWNKNLDK